MKTLLFTLLAFASNAMAVQVNVKCHGDEVIVATDKISNELKGAYVCKKGVKVPVAIIKNENFDDKLDYKDSISFYVSKEFTLYMSFLSKKFENFDQGLNDHLAATGEKDGYFKIDFEDLYDREEIDEIVERVKASVGSSKKITAESEFENNDFNLRKRYYDPKTQRFLSPDPKGFAAGDPNFYRYVENNPLRYTDPFGWIKYNQPPPGTVPVTGTTLEFAQCMEACSGAELTISGGAESSGHGAGSKHYTGQACDISKARNPHITPEDVQFCYLLCGKTNYYGQDEGRHYHFQVTPGRGGATGYRP